MSWSFDSSKKIAVIKEVRGTSQPRMQKKQEMVEDYLLLKRLQTKQDAPVKIKKKLEEELVRWPHDRPCREYTDKHDAECRFQPSDSLF